MCEPKQKNQEKLEELLKEYGVDYMIPILELESLNANNIIYLDASLLLKHFTTKPVGEFCNFCRAIDEFKKMSNVSKICLSYSEIKAITYILLSCY